MYVCQHFQTSPGPIEAKFYTKPPWDGGTKVYSNGPGHTTNMATMLIYGKNLKKSSVEVFDLKVGTQSQINDYMKI